MMGYSVAVMVLNAVVQCLLLAGVNRMHRTQSQWLRILLAGAMVGLYAGICLLSRFSMLAAVHWHFLILALAGILAFGISAAARRHIAVYILLNMAMEGISFGLDAGKQLSVIGALIIMSALCGICLFGKKAGRRYVPMEIHYGDRCIRLTALEDTGNMLTDPLTGQQVFVVNPCIANRITGLTQQQLRDPLEAIKKSGLAGLRLIPYRTVGQEGAFLLALRMQVKIGNTSGKYLVAFAPEMFGQVSTYQALAGGIDL